ncbi:Purine efflux pump PbuE [Streptomyces sp. enrichment culture]|uniref:MFS transporter n=1 Tax=Streptomyces sp. enrichment culture TaxID=1795815 RepID=UPI003F54B51A
MTSRSRTPALLALSVAYFALVAAALAVVGLGTSITGDLGLAPSATGTLVTVYTLVFALGSPLAAIALGRLGKKPVLLIGLVLMLLGGLVSAVAPGPVLLVAARLIQGVGAAVFAPTASIVAAAIVPPERRAWGLSFIGVGATAAMVLGAPLASTTGAMVGWRWTLAALAGLLLAGLIGLIVFLPPLPAGAALQFRAFAPAVRTSGAQSILWTTLLVFTAQYVVYGAVGGYLAQRFDTTATTASAVLLVFGVTALCGNTLGARLYTRLGGDRVLAAGITGIALAFAAAALLPGRAWAAFAVFGLWGLFNPLFLAPQQARLVDLDPTASGVLLPLNTTSVYLGMSLGSMLGSTFLAAAGAPALSALALVPLALAALTHRASFAPRLNARVGKSADPAQESIGAA